MDNKIPEDMLERVAVLPEHVRLHSGRQGKGAIYAKIATTLNHIKTGESLVYSDEEFNKVFGGKPWNLNNLRISLKGLGIKKPGIHKDNGKVWIFNRTEV